MKYIAYYGSVMVSILCLILFAIMVVIGIINARTAYDVADARWQVSAVVLLPALSAFFAWIVCDMKKRMKDL